ncbi:MAG: 3-phosphoshikimate 1-carboxyvinyltransferase [Oscillospiraceae bacterium]|nr:3-phosphoshikimate 1-carboxyvinyltransferase [Oscillospiraceae bacterium]
MNKTLAPGERTGCVRVPASKSQAHRLLICAALGTGETLIRCDGISRDIAATMDCLKALGAEILLLPDGQIQVKPIQAVPAKADLYCGESGSTLRFLLPVVGALGATVVFHMEGRLPKRPLAPLDEQLRDHGMQIEQMGDLLLCSGQLRPGAYTLPGNVSSQYISGLLMALPLLPGDSSLTVSGQVESAAYITMTEDALSLSGIRLEKNENRYSIPGGQRASLPEQLQVEADYSNAAFFLSIGALSGLGMNVKGLSPDSSQGDKAIMEILGRFGAELWIREDAVWIRRGALCGCEIDAAPIPDLIPVLSVVASVAKGETRIVNAARLRLKESDRLASTTQMLKSLGADITELDDGLVIRGVEALTGGTVDACGDHRIAMAAAVAACACKGPVNVIGAECVQKSYPRFWEDFEQLTGGEV